MTGRLAVMAALAGNACTSVQPTVVRAESPSTLPAPLAAEVVEPVREAVSQNTETAEPTVAEPANELPAPPEKTASEAEPEPTLPSGTTVLHIGDSMAWSLGIPLNKILKEAGLRSVTRAKTATYTTTWAYGEDIPLSLNYYDPDLVLISLGANEIQINNPAGRAKTVRKLVGRLEGRPCVWIAPPLWKDDTGILSVIRDNCAPCRYMDTNALVHHMPRHDGVHPSSKARRVWAEYVAGWLARQRDPEGESPWDLLPSSADDDGPILDFDQAGELK
jgi:lysophospholipase L1-like esterase